MTEELEFTIDEFVQFCSDRKIRRFVYHTRDQRESDGDMDFCMTFPPPFCAFNSDTFLFRNAKDRMTLRRVRTIRYIKRADSPVAVAVFLCGGCALEYEKNSYVFTVSS